MITGKFPSLRLRRSRKNSWSRRLIEENNLTPNDFILPIFLIEGKNKKLPIKSMPDVYLYTLDKINKVVDNAIKNGATGGKLLGAGGGGYFIFYVKSEERNNFLRWTKEENIICTSFKFVEDGLSSWITRY